MKDESIPTSAKFEEFLWKGAKRYLDLTAKVIDKSLKMIDTILKDIVFSFCRVDCLARDELDLANVTQICKTIFVIACIEELFDGARTITDGLIRLKEYA